MDIDHYNQKQVRDAVFINPPNILKAKVGSGGLSDIILDRAQRLIEENTTDFTPVAESYLSSMERGINAVRQMESNDQSGKDMEDMIRNILYPCVQLKANGGMFNYPLITRIADRFVQFMEVIEKLDQETLDIAQAFMTTIRVVLSGKIKGDGGAKGEALVEELNKACMRYFEKSKNPA